MYAVVVGRACLFFRVWCVILIAVVAFGCVCCRASPVCVVARACVFRVSGWIDCCFIGRVISHDFSLLDFYLRAVFLFGWLFVCGFMCVFSCLVCRG